ncbi:MAG: hypothetical protein J1F41_06105 [Lachnospiraceae bacterium]|nr:hypothetical protein [Lachnospiraceae bacterium]
MRKLAIMFLCAMTVVWLGGCGTSFDASAYLQAILDNSYKNDSSLLVSQKVGTAEEAAELYNQTINLQVDAMLSGTNPTDAQKDEYRQIVKDILNAAKYTVGEAEKQDDNSYVVTVTYEKMNVFLPALENLNARSEDQKVIWEESDEEVTLEDVYKWQIDTYKECLKSALENVTYEAPEDMTVRIKLSGRTYSPDTSDIESLSNALFDSN